MLVTERRKKSLREKGWIFHSAEGKMFLHYRVYGDFLKTSCMQKAGLPLPCLIQSGRQYRAASFAVPPEVSHKFNSYLPSSCTPTTLVKQGQRRGRLDTLPARLLSRLLLSSLLLCQPRLFPSRQLPVPRMGAAGGTSNLAVRKRNDTRSTWLSHSQHLAVDRAPQRSYCTRNHPGSQGACRGVWFTAAFLRGFDAFRIANGATAY